MLSLDDQFTRKEGAKSIVENKNDNILLVTWLYETSNGCINIIIEDNINGNDRVTNNVV